MPDQRGTQNARKRLGQQKGEGFEYHILVVAIALALMFKGGGRWALDSLIAEKLTRNARTQ